MFRNHVSALALLAAFAMPLAAGAQSGPNAPAAAAPGARAHHGHHHNGYQRELRHLNLSDAQKQQIRTIARTNARQLHQQIDSVLTDAQRAQMRADFTRARAGATTPRGSTPRAPQ
jgi:Spy/CpxP family protein refolding chaperone